MLERTAFLVVAMAASLPVGVFLLAPYVPVPETIYTYGGTMEIDKSCTSRAELLGLTDAAKGGSSFLYGKCPGSHYFKCQDGTRLFDAPFNFMVAPTTNLALGEAASSRGVWTVLDLGSCRRVASFHLVDAANAVWSPDGNKLAIRARDGVRVWQTDAPSHLPVIAPGGWEPSEWSPGGGALVLDQYEAAEVGVVYPQPVQQRAL